MDRRGVCFDRPLFEALKIEPLTQAKEQPAHEMTRKQRWGAPAEEDRPRPDVRAGPRIPPQVRFREQQFDEPRHAVFALACNAVEVAVMALVDAEREVDI